MRNIVTFVLLWIPVGGLVGAESASHAAEPAMLGIAAGYPDDEGIQKDAAVILYEGYELPSIDALKDRGWRWSTYNKGVYRLSADPSLAFGGRQCLVKNAIEGAEGAIMPRDITENGPVYHRVYLKVPRDAPNVRVMGITGVKDGLPTWKAIGSAGMPGGEAYYCVTLTFQNRNGKYRPMWYPYHADQFGPWGSNWSIDAEVPIDRWFCMEIMVKLNTPAKKPRHGAAGSRDGNRDGELRMWIDGKEVYTRTDLRYRDSEDLRTRMIFDQCYTSRGFSKNATFLADNRVVARKYVGPRVSEKQEPTYVPPVRRAEKIEQPAGLAAKYASDKGIESDPAVILAEDFEVESADVLQQRGWVPRHGTRRWSNGQGETIGWKGYQIARDDGSALAGKACLTKWGEAGGTGAKMTYGLPAGEEVLYQRAYLKLPAELSGETTRLMAVTGVPDGEPTYQTYGSDTHTGRDPFWVVLGLCNIERDGKIRNRHLRLMLKKTDYQFVLSGTKNALPVDRWFCLEMMVKLNTPGRRNGEIRVWQDGAEVFHHTQLPIRKTDSVKIRSVEDQCRIDSRRFTRPTRFWVDNLVVANAYIGPMQTGPKGNPSH